RGRGPFTKDTFDSRWQDLIAFFKRSATFSSHNAPFHPFRVSRGTGTRTRDNGGPRAAVARVCGWGRSDRGHAVARSTRRMQRRPGVSTGSVALQRSVAAGATG